jgi:hypothetical protein
LGVDPEAEADSDSTSRWKLKLRPSMINYMHMLMILHRTISFD